MASTEKQFTNYMDLRMTINEIEEKFFNYIEYRLYMNGGKAFLLHHELGTVLENTDGIYLTGTLFQGDVAKNTEIQQFLSYFNHTKVLLFDIGDEELAYIFKLHGFKNDIR